MVNHYHLDKHRKLGSLYFDDYRSSTAHSGLKTLELTPWEKFTKANIRLKDLNIVVSRLCSHHLNVGFTNSLKFKLYF